MKPYAHKYKNLWRWVIAFGFWAAGALCAVAAAGTAWGLLIPAVVLFTAAHVLRWHHEQRLWMEWTGVVQLGPMGDKEIETEAGDR